MRWSRSVQDAEVDKDAHTSSCWIQVPCLTHQLLCLSSYSPVNQVVQFWSDISDIWHQWNAASYANNANECEFEKEERIKCQRLSDFNTPECRMSFPIIPSIWSFLSAIFSLPPSAAADTFVSEGAAGVLLLVLASCRDSGLFCWPLVVADGTLRRNKTPKISIFLLNCVWGALGWSVNHQQEVKCRRSL